MNRLPLRHVAPLVVASAALLAPSLAAAQYGGGMRQNPASFWDRVVADSATELEAALERGQSAEAEGDIAGAMSAYREAIELEPGSPEGWLRALQLAWHRERAVFDAVMHQARATPGVAEMPPVLFFAAVDAMERQAWDEAIDALERATRFREQLGDASVYYANLAEAHMAAGHLDEATFFYRQALSVDPRYPHARAGLALARVRAGAMDDALAQVMQLVMDDPQLAFLEEPGVFLVPDGDAPLLRGLVAAASRNDTAARVFIEAWAETPSAASMPDDVRAIIEALPSQPDDRVVRIDVPGCRPIRIDVTTTGDRAAVVCEGSDVRQGAIRDGAVTWSRVTGFEYSTSPGSAAYDLVDIAWAPDGSSLRLMWSNNQVEEIPVSTGRSTGLRGYGNADLRTISFDNSGDRVVFTSFYTGGLQLASFDASSVPSSAGYLSTGAYPSRAWVSSDGRRAALTWNRSIQMFDTATWAFVGEVTRPVADTSIEIALMDDGVTTVQSRGSLLLTESLGAGAPTSAIALPIAGDAVVLAIDAVDSDTVAAATTDAIWLVRID